jgi:hypothetical protein
MHRLAHGIKGEVDVKQMKKLTSKNYEQLPEIKRKKEEETKKAELKNRMAQAKLYGKTVKDVSYWLKLPFRNSTRLRRIKRTRNCSCDLLNY